MTPFSTASSNNISQKNFEERLRLEHLLEAKPNHYSTAGIDVVEGLTNKPKILAPRYLYDDKGSELFEQICELPEYYPTRTEKSILQEYSHEIAQMTGACELVELGSGSSTKTRVLLDAYKQLDYPLHYLPIDVSAGILESSARQLLADYPSMQIHALAGTYELALEKLESSQLSSRLICIIGGTLGNLKPADFDLFISQITGALQPGEYFLAGVDLRKPKHIIEAAYNDSAGVTAAFNLNVLDHLNWRFDGNFNRSQFEHWAFFNDTESQIEMHVRSLRSQTVELQALNLKVEFEEGETIRTEISRKFDFNHIQEQLKTNGLNPVKVFTDANKYFAVILAQRS